MASSLGASLRDQIGWSGCEKGGDLYSARAKSLMGGTMRPSCVKSSGSHTLRTTYFFFPVPSSTRSSGGRYGSSTSGGMILPREGTIPQPYSSSISTLLSGNTLLVL